ncbi:putative late blight resistance protein homolog R1A-3 [Primulina huaijiensis]|uniref:putative late blight resistance protein homolog R1A-3 n=1 Tax=Primulina huaijiensis TaxID=1492673 RepID=UPI003CC71CB9
MAYAALVILIQNLEEILRDNPLSVHLRKQHIETLHEDASSLLSFLRDSEEKGYDHELLKELEMLTRDGVHKAADFIDSYVFINRSAECGSRWRVGWKQISLLAHQSFTQIIEEIKSIKLKVLKIYESKVPGREVLAAKNPPVQDLSLSSPDLEEKLVGIDTDIEMLVLRLAEPSLHLQVIPIVGMGGIGKTTLAKRIYDDPYIVYHFYVRAWVTITQGLTVSVIYQVRTILLSILGCLTTITDEIREKTNEELGEQLYQNLKGMRYLVVLDDMWDTKAWNNLKMFFPDDVNGSRIMLTSRLYDVADCVCPNCSPHCMHFLRASESWDLLKSKLPATESFPPELVETGKHIAKRCQGLPLAVVVVAGILNKMGMNLEVWKKIAESVDALVSEDPERHLDILALSYNCLPGFLKACFLYMGSFPRDYDIPASRLLWLWVAEGFINPVAGKSFEDVAEKYLEDLVSRNLILVGKRRSNGTIKSCYIHDLLRDLCEKESKKENFLNVIKRFASIYPMQPVYQRRVSLHASILHYSYSVNPMPLTRSFLCFDMNKILPDFFLSEFMDQMDFKLLRVLDIMLLRSNHFPIEIVDLVNLRYLALAVNCELPGSICKLKNLQTLIIDHIWEGQYLPWEIWKMRELRHVHLRRGCYFPLPCSRNTEDNSLLVLKNLQTLSTIIGTLSCSKEIFARVMHLRKLEIFGTESDSEAEWHSECLSNLVCLKELETLKCSFLYRPRKHRLPQWKTFPENLKKLTLSGSYFPWVDMATLGMLPNLEVLKLRHFAFEGFSWNPVEDGFPQLKVLLMENSDPVNWDAESSHFPNLRRLVLRECQRLREIPEGIGYISTLEIIELHDCEISLVNSARAIHEEQQALGNEEIEIKITWGDNHPTADFFPERKLFS